MMRNSTPRIVGDDAGTRPLRGRALPDGLSVGAALVAERAIAEWEGNSRQPIDLAIELFAIFQGPDVQQHPEGSV